MTEPATFLSRSGRIALTLAGLALIVSVSWAVLRRATPPSGSEPKSATAAPAPPSILVALQQRTRVTPNDPEAWRALGQAQADLGQYGEAAKAYGQGTRLAPQRADLWSAFGEARVMSSASDPMPPEALAAFRKAVAIDPKDPRARYFIAVARDLTGDHAGAIGDWLALLQDTPPGAPWERDLRRTIEQVGKINRIDVAKRLAAVRQPEAHALTADMPDAASAIPGPTPEQMRAAAALPPGQQDVMVQNMLGALEAKLKADPTNVDGWIMLMRSRMTLGETSKAAAALKDAVAANPGATTHLRAVAATLGVPAA